MLMVRHAAFSHRGLVREENQDSWFAAPERGLYIVSDGMGGQHAGTLASKIVVETLPGLLLQAAGSAGDFGAAQAKDAVMAGLSDLSRQIRARTEGEPGLDGMGATVVLVWVRDAQAVIAHMGDSRAYLLRRGRIVRLTHDHTIVQLLIDNGEISASEAASHPARGTLTRCVGMDGEPLPEVQLLDLKHGDRLLLCSDGLSGMVNDAELRAILRQRVVPETICARLVDAANQAGGRDNITAVVLNVAR